MKTFNDYLEEICFEENPTILDDDMPDFFDGWLCELDTEQLISLAQKWGDEINEKTSKRIGDIIKKIDENGSENYSPEYPIGGSADAYDIQEEKEIVRELEK